jgi:hypothetical protein
MAVQRIPRETNAKRTPEQAVQSKQPNLQGPPLTNEQISRDSSIEAARLKFLSLTGFVCFKSHFDPTPKLRRQTSLYRQNETLRFGAAVPEI